MNWKNKTGHRFWVKKIENTKLNTQIGKRKLNTHIGKTKLNTQIRKRKQKTENTNWKKQTENTNCKNQPKYYWRYSVARGSLACCGLVPPWSVVKSRTYHLPSGGASLNAQCFGSVAIITLKIHITVQYSGLSIPRNVL